MNVITISDTDWYEVPKHPVEDIDLVFCLGDIADSWIINRVKALNPTYGAYAVRGNHDPKSPAPPPVHDLCFRSITITPKHSTPITIAGIPGSWKYKGSGHWLYEQEEIEELVQTLPKATILLSHNSPAGLGHERQELPDSFSPHQGFHAITSYINRQHPLFVFHGHQHLQKKSTHAQSLIIGCYGEEYHSIIIHPS